ncbi:MAG TPA: hypothetical protein GXX20_08710 [Clostridiaceae bacterium]|nr:hypothetical protein [Clostridiaceae bacterium]
MKKLFKPFGSIEKEAEMLRGIVDVIGIQGNSKKQKWDEIIKKLTISNILLADIDINVNEELLSYARSLYAIVCRSIGVDFVDVKLASEKGILVVNSPDFCVISVAEFTIGLMISLLRRIPEGISAVSQGKWELRTNLKGAEITGKVLGIIGFGKIGREVAVRAKGLGMEVIVFDPYVTTSPQDNKNYRYVDSIEMLLKQSDVVTIHTPLTASTRGLIGMSEISMMKDGAYLINVARGGIIDEMAVYEALRSEKLAGAALDVLTQEPPGEEHIFMNKEINNLLITPHIAWNTVEASKRNKEIFIEQISSIVNGEIPRGVVNPEVIPAWKDKLKKCKS